MVKKIDLYKIRPPLTTYKEGLRRLNIHNKTTLIKFWRG